MEADTDSRRLVTSCSLPPYSKFPLSPRTNFTCLRHISRAKRISPAAGGFHCGVIHAAMCAPHYTRNAGAPALTRDKHCSPPSLFVKRISFFIIKMQTDISKKQDCSDGTALFFVTDILSEILFEESFRRPDCKNRLFFSLVFHGEITVIAHLSQSRDISVERYGTCPEGNNFVSRLSRCLSGF